MRENTMLKKHFIYWEVRHGNSRTPLGKAELWVLSKPVVFLVLFHEEDC